MYIIHCSLRIAQNTITENPVIVGDKIYEQRLQDNVFNELDWIRKVRFKGYGIEWS
jgi:hypothetical protein